MSWVTKRKEITTKDTTYPRELNMIEFSWPVLLLSVIGAIFLTHIVTNLRKRHLSLSFEGSVTKVMADVDDGRFIEEEESGPLFFTPGMCKTRFRAKVVLAAKAEYGRIKRNEANYMMVRKFLRDLMRTHGLRPSHIAQHVDVCTSLFFIPSKSEIDAHKISASHEAVARDGCVSDTWQSAYSFFGGMLGFPSE